MKIILVILFWSILFTSIGGGLLHRNLTLIEKGISTSGTVINYKKIYGHEEEDVYCPIIQFKLKSGSLFNKTFDNCSTPPSYSLNKTVEILYEEGKPENAIIKSIFWMFILPGIFIIIGLFPIFKMIPNIFKMILEKLR